MRRMTNEEAIEVLDAMKVKIEIPKAAVTQYKRNVSLDMAIEALRKIGRMEMSRLDKSIADVAYILDTLMTYRNIVESGCCNDCRIAKPYSCKHLPKPGQLVRYNCPFYERKENTDE